MTDPKMALDYAGHMAQMLDTEALRQIILHCRSAQAMLRDAVAQEAIDNALDGPVLGPVCLAWAAFGKAADGLEHLLTLKPEGR